MSASFDGSFVRQEALWLSQAYRRALGNVIQVRTLQPICERCIAPYKLVSGPLAEILEPRFGAMHPMVQMFAKGLLFFRFLWQSSV
jgi:hypothetical protein